MKPLSLQSMSNSFVRQTIFSALAIFLIVVLGFIVVYSTTFILKKSESALEISVEAAPQQRFDVQGYEKLQIVKQKKTN
ncbi:hypothetical protein C4565_05965 [Candidatus Parcubacteria bacterium]|jgi:hypothetical protein|nr:MAG: hypothetical protein C4565_05965 [Candidatus Parcubacteria bacterium]